ncbi:MAG: hypothetical protein LCH73_01055 [Proteobacteria bacterium]|nr:hypothetical protein [Pseudomonadota bacterium]
MTRPSLAWACTALLLSLAAASASAQTPSQPAAPSGAQKAPAKKAPAKKAASTKKAAAKKAPEPEPEVPPPPADDAQRAAAALVYTGPYACELNKTLSVTPDAQHEAYMDVLFGKTRYLVKPVLSTTGAVRLEDVKGQALMVQIAQKSMLLDVKVGQRLADDCVSEKQAETRRAVAAAEQEAAAKAAAEAAAEAEAKAKAAAAATAAAQAGSSAPVPPAPAASGAIQG